ncbi:polysaccharide biosynthesis tyrosine autokinase [Pseudarthrobacter sp. NCCP-2145]|uniref:polysaccharide biosynthesis tyrosine autokinase n=1 Tax=Pseudarthrobacter sp. NCCP-2145 TaxID=2942290 RepID=UPI00255952F0|nr:polysaccharide biosynthesis tyrosine autokinase [Pseudarthrobacter sp. NCCP-2145]
MDLSDLLRMVRRSWIIIASLSLLGLLSGATLTVMTKPTYTAETELFVAIQGSGSIQELQQGNTFSQARVQSYVQTVGTAIVLQPAIDALGLDLSPEQLSGRVQATSDPDTVLIKISVSDRSPVQAAATAQAVANSLVDAVDTLERAKSGDASPVGLSVIQPATAPVSPSAPNSRLNLSLGLLSGLALGLVVTVLRSTLDTRIRGEADIRESTDAPILGGIAFDPEAAKNPLLTDAAFQSPRAEAFRQLRTNLQFANVAEKAKTVLVTSSLPGEGKSTTATNLAIALAQAGQTVCLIDADLRRPMVNEYLSLDRAAGLTTALVGNAEVDDLLQPWGEDSLYVLTSGQIPPNPSELLGSSNMRVLIQRLEQEFDSVIVDAPPLLPVTDAAVLSQHVGGVLLVVGSHKLRHQDLKKSLDALQMVDSNLLGVVLNRLPSKGPDSYAYSYYSSEGTNQQVELRSASTRRPSRVAAPEADGDVLNAFDRTLLEASPQPARIFPRRKYDGPL